MHDLLNRALAVGTLVVTATVPAVAAANAAGAKTVSPENYAKSLCGAFRDVRGSHRAFNDAYRDLPVVDTAAFQAQAISELEVLLAEVEVAAADLAQLRPDVTRGKRVSRIFSSYFTDRAVALRAARDAFAAADPHGVSLAADVSAFEMSVSTTLQTADDPFDKIKNGELLDAFDEEPACENVVTVS